MRRRQGFTIVELLVAMALIVFIMAILSEAFVKSTQVFRDFKSLGDMNGRLRAATNFLAEDLAAEHFDGKRRLSDPGFFSNGPPSAGFFRVWQQSASVNEGNDLDGNPSYTSTGTFLHFTSKKRGNGFQDFVRADVSGDVNSPLPSLPYWDSRYQGSPPPLGVPTFPRTYHSQWYQVAWFLRPNGRFTENGTTQLYTLYRHQLAIVTDNTSVNWGTAAGQTVASTTTGYDEISCYADTTGRFYFPNPADITVPERRFGMTTTAGTYGTPVAGTNGYPIYDTPPASNTYDLVPASAANTKKGADLVLNDVLSFDVRFLVLVPPSSGTGSWVPASDFMDLNTLNTTYGGYKAQPNFPASGTGAVFDTWSSVLDDTYDYSGWASTIPFRQLGTTNAQDIQIKAIKVSIRIWDFKTQRARQVSLIQDM
jgi:prepilin-type N-terminal cleavage/methylation domain-containing protein